MRIAVTGASGFIGSAACAALVEAGHEVFGYGRRPRPLHLVAQARYARWDISGGPLPDPPCVDVVLHCAAEVDDWAPLALQRRTTVAGTVAVLDTWPDARLVHVSSASVYPPWRQGVVSEHDGPSRRHAGPYSRAKTEAEAVVARRATGGAEVLVLRPHAVYGPGDPTLLPRLLAAVRTTRGGRRVLVVPGPASTLIHLTSLDLLAHVCRVACESGTTGTVNVADAGPLRLGQALDAAFVAATGSAPRRVHLPRVLVRALAVVVEAAARLGRREQAPVLTRYAVSHLAVSRVLDLTRLREELGIDPAATDLSRVRSATSPGAAAAAVTVGAEPALAARADRCMSLIRVAGPPLSDTPRPGLVRMLCGVAGAGKTTFAQELEGSGFTRLSVDEEIWRRFGAYGTDYPEPDYEGHQVVAEQAVRADLERLMSERVPVVLDLSLWQRTSRQRYKALVERHGCEWELVHLSLDVDTLAERLRSRSGRRDPNAAFPVSPARLTRFLKGFEVPQDEGETVLRWV